MPVSVTLPALGESVTEGTVTRWLKQVGDTVATDEPLLEVSTDKVDTEIPSPAAGTLLEIKVAEDETVEVGAELATIGDADEQPAGDSGDSASDSDSADADGADADGADARRRASPRRCRRSPMTNRAPPTTSRGRTPASSRSRASRRRHRPPRAAVPIRAHRAAGPERP